MSSRDIDLTFQKRRITQQARLKRLSRLQRRPSKPNTAFEITSDVVEHVRQSIRGEGEYVAVRRTALMAMLEHYEG